MDFGYKPTTNGRALIAKCMALEKPVELTRVAVGSGRTPEGVNLADVHELYQYVADGAVGALRHENDRLYMTVQYANSFHPEIPTFYLAEFLVYAQDPESGEDVDLLYATLGDYIQPVPAYSPDLPTSLWDFPLVLVISDEIEVSVSGSPGLVTYADLQEAVTRACTELVDSMATGGIKKTIEFTMPAADWLEDPKRENGYGFYYDLTDPEITSKQIPEVVIAEESLQAAAQAGMCATANTDTGYVRMKSVLRPSADISASCHLLVQGAADSGVSNLPVATADTPGAVMVKPDSGLVIDADGNLSVDFASEEQAAEAIDEGFGS